MQFLAVAVDYDGTLANDGRVAETTLACLRRAQESGRKLILVTGRELDSLLEVFPEVSVFDRVVAENGALLYRPAVREERPLSDPPPAGLVRRLRELGVQPLSVGRSLIATVEPQAATVLETIRHMGLALHVVFNKGSVMVLPRGTNKGTGLRAALAELDVPLANLVGIGDAENDHAFLGLCARSAAVANALPSLKAFVDVVATQPAGAGVVEIMNEMLASDR